MKNCIVCTICKRTVSAGRNWSRDQVGRSAEWRVSRHRSTDKRAPKGTRETICPGSGIVVTLHEILAVSA
jgi:hypothetical protein